MTAVYDKGFRGAHLNGPNDLWQDAKGGIYFTDPYYHRDYWEKGHKQEQDIQAVYYLEPSGELVRVIEDLRQPNGIVGTPDGSSCSWQISWEEQHGSIQLIPMVH
jgi:gluconolactonase